MMVISCMLLALMPQLILLEMSMGLRFPEMGVLRWWEHSARLDSPIIHKVLQLGSFDFELN